MNKNVLIVLGGAVIVAVLVALLVQMSIGGKEPEQVAAKEEPKTFILVAAKDLGVGQELKEGDLRWQEWPQNAMFSGAVQRKGDIKITDAAKGRLRRDLAKGEPFMTTYLLSDAKSNFVAASLEPGKRAVTIEVSATTMVAGFISVGDFVDVVLTYRSEASSRNVDNEQVRELLESSIDEFAVERIVENVRVLAVDQTAQRPEDGKIRVGKTVTLELGVKDAERVILAQQIGELTLVLRGVGDKETISQKWPITSDKRLIGIDDEIRRDTKKIENETSIRSEIVRIYNGGDVNSTPVQ